MKRLVLAGLLTFAAGQISYAQNTAIGTFSKRGSAAAFSKSRRGGGAAKSSPYSLTPEDTLSGCSGDNCATYNPDGSITRTVVPEPATLLLIGGGLVGAGLLFRKRIRAKRG